MDLKPILKFSIEENPQVTLGDLRGSSLLHEILFGSCTGDIFDKQREISDELKKQIPIWKEKYGFNEDTTLKEILEKI